MLVLGGFAFKIAAVPFHWWAPDVYQGAPVPVAAYLATVSKAGGVAGLLLVTTVAFGPYREVWSAALAVLAVLSMTWGNLVALRQRQAVRLLAWSSVAQAGYLLVPLGAVGADPDLVPEAVAATVGYLILYVAMNTGAFACVTAAGVTAIEDFRGLARRSPLLAGALAVFLLGPGRPAADAGRARRQGGGAAVRAARRRRLARRRGRGQHGDRPRVLPPRSPPSPSATADRAPARLRLAPSLAVAVTAAFVVTALLSVAPGLALGLTP